MIFDNLTAGEESRRFAPLRLGVSNPGIEDRVPSILPGSQPSTVSTK